MAFYRAIVRCYIDNAIRAEGDEFEYNGPTNTNLVLVDGQNEEEDVPASKPKRAAKPKAD
jgi:hypothetical protein|tara:strand:+ start:363 stop:542 length:180 start_codon:yes stop_codon:yes gene_type:complete